MIEHRFPDGFLWGASTSALQVEGATRAEGRTPKKSALWYRQVAASGGV